MCSRCSKWYWRERKKVLGTFYVKWNFNFNCNSNKNICEAIITVTFPCKQTIMKQDMNKLNLVQFECRIQYVFLLLLFLISQINHTTTSVWFVWQCVLFLMVIYFYYLSFTSWYMRRIKSTLVILHIVSKPYNWLNFIWSKTWKVMEEVS